MKASAFAKPTMVKESIISPSQIQAGRLLPAPLPALEIPLGIPAWSCAG
ncbi:MAG: hypothetical protein ACLVKR_07175 [Lachnospiraceae bacterium]